MDEIADGEVDTISLFDREAISDDEDSAGGLEAEEPLPIEMLGCGDALLASGKVEEVLPIEMVGCGDDILAREEVEAT